MRQADALALAAGQGRRGAVQRQVVQAHVQHELDPFPQFFQDVPGDVLLPLVEAGGDLVQPLPEGRDFHRGDIGNGLAVDPKAQGFLTEARSPAVGTHERILDMVDHSVPGLHLGEVPVADAEQFVRAVNQERHRLVGQRADGLIEAESVFPGDGTHDVELLAFADLPQRDDGPVGDGLGPVRDDGVHIDVHDGPEALAMRAIALRRIEGEGMRLGLLEGSPGLGIHQVLGEMLQHAALQVHHRDGPLAGVQRVDHGVPHPLVVPVPGLEPVHHKFDEMRLVAVQGRYFLQGEDFPVDADLGEAPLAELLEQFPVVALAAADERGEQIAFPAPVRGHDEVRDLRVRIADHLLPALR